MRQVINISLPSELNKKAEEVIRAGRYATKNEFFRDLIRVWEEEQVLRELRGSQKEIAKGRGKILRSLKDLR